MTAQPFRLLDATAPGDFGRGLPAPRPDLSFVIPAHDEAENIERVLREVSAEATRLGRSHEIIVIDDGSRDDTFDRARALTGTLPLRVLRLSRNFGKEQAMSAGLEATTGTVVVIMDADRQEPIEALEVMLAHLADGLDMVYAVRADRNDEPALKRLLTAGFYRLLTWGAEADIPPDARDFRVMNRRVVEALLALPEHNRFMKGLFGWVGFRSAAVPIRMRPRDRGTSSFGFRRLAGLALTGLTAFTTWPLRIWSLIGAAVATAAMGYGTWIALRTLIWGTDLPGFATLATAICLLGGLQLLSIGIIGEYLARTYAEVKGRPGFIIAEDTATGAMK